MSSAVPRPSTSVELFTHPVCSGCQEAVSALSKLAQQGTISLDICSLGTPSGRRRAEEQGVTSVPTVRIGDQYKVLMQRSDLERLIDDLDSN